MKMKKSLNYIGFNEPDLDTRAVARCPPCCPPEVPGGDGPNPNTLRALLLGYEWGDNVTGWEWAGLAFGTVITPPSTPVGDIVTAMRSNYAGNAIMLKGYNNLPYVNGYEWTSTGFGNRYSDPTVPPTADAYWFFSGEFNRADNAYIVNTNSTDGGFVAYPFDPITGFGTAYALPTALPYPDPSYIGSVGDIRVSPDDDFIIAGGLNAILNGGFIGIEWDNTAGFGLKYTEPGEYSATDNNGRSAMDMHPSGEVVAFAGPTNSISNPWSIDVFPFDASTGFGTRFANPAAGGTSNGAQCNGVAFSPTGGAIAAIYSSGIAPAPPRAKVWAWDNVTGFGSAYALPGDFPDPVSPFIQQPLHQVLFSPEGDAIIFIWGYTPYVIAYEWDDATGFGTRIADPSPVPDPADWPDFDPEDPTYGGSFFNAVFTYR